MKKVILSALALVFCAALSAQVTDKDGNTVGPSVPNFIMPTGVGNAGESYQTGADQRVDVDQIGTNQFVYTDQVNGAGNGSNRARIAQAGTVVPAGGENNIAEVGQSGTANSSDIDQGGGNNVAGTFQIGTDNRAFLQQGLLGQAEENFAWIDQNGDNNRARTLQWSDGSDALTVQLGNANEANILQIAGPPNNSEGHLAYIDQEGNNNRANILQLPGIIFDGGNEAEALQTGDNNFSLQTQLTTGSAGFGNSALVNQGDQDPNDATRDAGTVDPLYNPADFDGPVEFTAPGDPAVYEAGSTNNQALQFQLGGQQNRTEIHQFAENNYAEQRQVTFGANNDAVIVQNAFGSPNNAGANNAWQNQFGTSNSTASTVQVGGDNTAFQDQLTGANSEVYSYQSDDGNELFTRQSANNNYGLTEQRGDSNDILLVQRDGGHSYTVLQNSNGFPSGNGNISNILQEGPGGTGIQDAASFPGAPTLPPFSIPGPGTFNIPNPFQ